MNKFDVWNIEHHNKVTWVRRTETFSVEISCLRVCNEYKLSDSMWEVWVIIHQQHPLFATLIRSDSREEHQKTLDQMPFHGGVSWDRIDVCGDLYYIKIGAHYSHEGDERFGKLQFLGDAGEILEDADKLFEYMSNFSPVLTKLKSTGCLH